MEPASKVLKTAVSTRSSSEGAPGGRTQSDVEGGSAFSEAGDVEVED